ncbi:MAG: hypothetical protein ACYC3I_27260 [Gemmataceae bacterium]
MKYGGPGPIKELLGFVGGIAAELDGPETDPIFAPGAGALEEAAEPLLGGGEDDDEAGQVL